MKRSMKKLALFLMMAAIGTFIAAAVATAGDRHYKKTIQGDYAFTGEATCIVSPWGFNPDLTPKGGTYFTSFSIQGVWTFNHDGTGTRQGRCVITTFSSSNTASSVDIQASFTYVIGPDDTITTQLSSPLTAQILTGIWAGQTYTTDQIRLKGMISKDNKSLTLATDEPQIETVTYSNGYIFPQICHRSRVLIRLDENEEHR